MKHKAIDAKIFTVSASSIPQECIKGLEYFSTTVGRDNNIQYVQLNWREKKEEYPKEIHMIRDEGLPKAKQIRMKLGKY